MIDVSVILFAYTAASILKRLDANCLQTATAPQGGTQKWLQDPFLRTHRGHPPAPRLRPAVVETHNVKTL